jgi:prophage antirepressor-like protein
MKSLELFHFKGKQVRTIQLDGEPWFVAADVCDVLGLNNPSQALSYLDRDERRLITNEAWRTNGSLAVVSEPGLYSLVLRSRRPEAKGFRRWIAHEVIPALRRTGGYQLSDVSATVVGSGNLIQFSRRDLLNLAIEAEAECDELRGKNTSLLQENEKLRPKAEFFDRVADSSDSFSLAETAKLLETEGYGRNNLIKFLRREGILMASNVAKQRYIDRGYFHIVQSEYYAPDGTPRIKAVTRVYEKGVNFIRHRLDNYFRQYMERQNAGC